jgi:phage baseplate assembly protein W
MSEDFIGKGWAFPIRADATGRIALVAREQELAESIRLILSTAKGERPMRPEFGCGIHDQIFSPMDATTAGRVSYDVRAALERWEPRIDVTAVDVTYGEGRQGVMYVDITYSERETNDRRNLVFPFYVIPEELDHAVPQNHAVPQEQGH